MIRYNTFIRLSSVDLALFASLTGPDLPPPLDVADYNQRLRQAASTWAQGSSAEERLLVDIAEGLLLDEADPSAVINQDKLPTWPAH